MAGKLQQTSDASFASDVLSASAPVLVDFWATWCGPCRALEPHLQATADEFSEKVSVFKLNIDENQETAQQYGVTSIPTILVFKGGELVDRLNGNPGPVKLKEFVSKQV
jgi:thioredoxin 1